MPDRDCNTCLHHKQGAAIPPRCRACLHASGYSQYLGMQPYLPQWEPKMEPITLAPVGADVLERSDLSPHAVVTDYKGIGGAPSRATTLPDVPAERKKFPVASGVLDYFPDAIVAVSRLSYQGNEQHNPGKPLHWDRSKSTDEADTMLRHFLQRGTLDTDGMRHSAKMAWRALALLQKEIEGAK